MGREDKEQLCQVLGPLSHWERSPEASNREGSHYGFEQGMMGLHFRIYKAVTENEELGGEGEPELQIMTVAQSRYSGMGRG